MKKYYKMYLLGLALLRCGVVNTDPYGNFMGTLPDGVLVPPGLDKMLRLLLSPPAPGTLDQQGTYEELPPEQAAIYKDGVGFRNLTPQEVQDGYSGMEGNKQPRGRFKTLDACIRNCIQYIQDPKNGFETTKVMCWGLFPITQVEPFRIFLAQHNFTWATDSAAYDGIFKNKILLHADTNDAKLKIIYRHMQKSIWKGLTDSETLFCQAISLAIQDVLVIRLTDAGPELKIFRIYEGGYDEFLNTFLNLQGNTEPNTPAQLPSSSLANVIQRFGVPKPDDDHNLLRTLLDEFYCSL